MNTIITKSFALFLLLGMTLQSASTVNALKMCMGAEASCYSFSKEQCDHVIGCTTYCEGTDNEWTNHSCCPNNSLLRFEQTPPRGPSCASLNNEDLCNAANYEGCQWYDTDTLTTSDKVLISLCSIAVVLLFIEVIVSPILQQQQQQQGEQGDDDDNNKSSNEEAKPTAASTSTTANDQV